jgi:hypothetical protein
MISKPATVSMLLEKNTGDLQTIQEQMESHKSVASGQYDEPNTDSPKKPPTEAPGLLIGIRYKKERTGY